MSKEYKPTDNLPAFGEDIDALIKYINTYWVGLKGIKPKGYAEFCKDYCDFDGMEEEDQEALEKEFEGIQQYSPCSFTFPITISLPHVAYDDICQGRGPMRVLVGALVAYGMTRGELYYKQKLLDRLPNAVDSRLLELASSGILSKIIREELMSKY